MISGVSKSIFSEHNKATDLSGLTRQVTLKGKLDGKINLERMNSEVQRLKMDSEFDDLDKFRANSGGGHQRALGTTDTKATQKAATKFVQSTRNSSWIKTLTAVEGRPWPWMPVLSVAIVTVSVVCVELLYLQDTANFSKVRCPGDPDKMCWPYSLSVPSTTISVIGSALFFLMVFRTNASYDRWWEGRKKWGMIINRTRDFARQSSGFIKDPILTDRMIRWTIAFAVCTKRHLRFERELTELKHILGEQEVEEIQAAVHMPLQCLERLTQYMVQAREDPKESRVTDIVMTAMDANLTDFEDELGACERILKTPFPFAYVVHLRSFMVLWLYALPFALVSTCTWITIPTVTIVAYALMGIETIGVEIENPFGHDFNDLPLDAICKTIETNLLEILARDTKRKATLEQIINLHRERTRAVFNEYDADKTGAISVGNLAEVLKKTGTGASRKQVGALLKEYDPDDSGHIEFDEFEEVYINRVGLTDFAVALHAI
jgi:putative membrane protein